MVLDRAQSSSNHHPHHEHKQSSMAKNGGSQFLQNIAFYGFGLFNWFLFLVLGLTSGTFFRKPTEQDILKLKIARDAFWNLSKQPLPGFYHAFYKLRTGSKLHYICNKNGEPPASASDLVVFIHGFPDSSMMWRHLLREPALPTGNATLICVDLPGFGGSDSFEKYDTSVLEALTEFIVAMRELYTETSNGDPHKNTFIVGHDWGCTLTFRLASEAPELADHFIASNGILIDLAKANSTRVVHSSTKIFKQFRHSPWRNLVCLNKSFQVVKPLLKQLMLSGYIFAFNLPNVMVRYLGSGGNMCFIRGALRREHGRDISQYNAAESLAACLGPGLEDCSTEIGITTRNGKPETYGPSVRERAQSAGEVFLQQTAYYRHGLALKTWVKSLEAITDLYNIDSNMSSPNSAHRRRSSSASSALFSEHYKGSLGAPTTILWGEEDLAISRPICLDGIGDYLAKGSEVILLPRTGHWTAIEKESRGMMAKVIGSLVGKDHSLPSYLFDDVKSTYEGAQLLVKR